MWTHDESELQGWYDFKKKLSDAPVSSGSVMYYVQVGAFSSRDNAEAYLT
ncbi:MAG: SPOR domain-containing protein, partial [Huintestinicola sp.]